MEQCTNDTCPIRVGCGTFLNESPDKVWHEFEVAQEGDEHPFTCDNFTEVEI